MRRFFSSDYFFEGVVTHQRESRYIGQEGPFRKFCTVRAQEFRLPGLRPGPLAGFLKTGIFENARPSSLQALSGKRVRAARFSTHDHGCVRRRRLSALGQIGIGLAAFPQNRSSRILFAIVCDLSGRLPDNDDAEHNSRRRGSGAKPQTDHRLPNCGEKQSGDRQPGLRSKARPAVVAVPGGAGNVETRQAEGFWTCFNASPGHVLRFFRKKRRRAATVGSRACREERLNRWHDCNVPPAPDQESWWEPVCRQWRERRASCVRSTNRRQKRVSRSIGISTGKQRACKRRFGWSTWT